MRLKTKFDGVIVEGEPTFWLESKIYVVYIVEDIKQSNIYINYLSTYNGFVID